MRGKRVAYEKTKQQICTECGKEFLATRDRSSNPFRTTCSQECKGLAHRKRIKRTCKNCSKEFEVRVCHSHDGRGVFCCKRCGFDFDRRQSDARILQPSGYVLVNIPKGHPLYEDRKSRGVKNYHMREHRLVMERKIGRFLLPNETVHHINGVRDDNRPENLELWNRTQPSGQREEDLIEENKRLREENAKLKKLKEI